MICLTLFNSAAIIKQTKTWTRLRYDIYIHGADSSTVAGRASRIKMTSCLCRQAFFVYGGKIMTRDQIKNRLQIYLEAEAAILRGQSYRIADRELRRPDLGEVRRAINSLLDELNHIDSGGGRIKAVAF